MQTVSLTGTPEAVRALVEHLQASGRADLLTAVDPPEVELLPENVHPIRRTGTTR